MTTMPITPHVGLTFRPYGTDAVGTVLGIKPAPSPKGKRKPDPGKSEVTYHYDHEPESTFSRPYSELQKMAYKL